MHLHIHSDASYLSEKNARSRAGGLFFLGSAPTAATAATRPALSLQSPRPTRNTSPLNGAVHVHCSIMRAVLSSATEAETGALFCNAKEAVPLRITLEELGHP